MHLILLSIIIVWAILGFALFVLNEGWDFTQEIKTPWKAAIYYFICGPLTGAVTLFVLILLGMIFLIEGINVLVRRTQATFNKFNAWFKK